MGSKPLTTHLNGYLPATNNNTASTGILPFPPPWFLPPWWSCALTAAVSVHSILYPLGSGEVCQSPDLSIGSRCISILGSVVIFGPFYYETPYRDCAVATIFRGKIWDPLQLPPAVTRTRDPPLTTPLSVTMHASPVISATRAGRPAVGSPEKADQRRR